MRVMIAEFRAREASRIPRVSLSPRALFLLQHQLALRPDHAVQRVGEARQQPGQRDLEPHGPVIDVDKACGALAERGGAEAQTVAGPGLLLQRDQPGELGLGAAEPVLDAAQRLVLAEAVRKDDDEWLRHGGAIPLW